MFGEENEEAKFDFLIARWAHVHGVLWVHISEFPNQGRETRIRTY